MPGVTGTLGLFLFLSLVLLDMFFVFFVFFFLLPLLCCQHSFFPLSSLTGIDKNDAVMTFMSID